MTSIASVRTKRVLWVDDEIDRLRPHLLFLQQRGYHVDAISNGDDALALLRKNHYDLVMLDEQMPGRRGLEVLAILRREDPHARVVMVTKSEEDRTLNEAIGRQVDDYLVKPPAPVRYCPWSPASSRGRASASSRWRGTSRPASESCRCFGRRRAPTRRSLPCMRNWWTGTSG